VAEKATSGRPSSKTRKAPAKAVRNGGARRDQEVLDAATKVFHSRGYADASVQDVADELGILKGSLYHYIDSKEDLLFRLLEEAHDEVQAILDEVEAIEDLAPLDRLRLYIARQVEYTSRNLAKMAIYYHDVDQLSPARHKELMRKRRVHDQFVSALIAEAQKRGEVDPGLDPNLITNYVFGSMIWVYRWYKPGGKVRPQQLAETCADFVMHGVVGRR
jgi:AcrR family transcriptional regulator